MPISPEQEQLVFQWMLAKKRVEMEAKPLVEKEMELRRRVAASLFPNPKEGVNKDTMPNGWLIKFTYSIDRKVDKAALPAVKEQMREMGINPDPLIRETPELSVKLYKELNEEARKVFAQALTEKPGTPQVELVPPKES